MSTDENKRLIARLLEVGWGARERAVVEEITSPDCRRHHGGAITDGGDVFAVHAAFTAGVPDSKIEIELLVAEGDMVVARSRTTGTHLGEFLGFPPSGRKIDVIGTDFYRLRDGKVVESWHGVDEVNLRRQLGGSAL